MYDGGIRLIEYPYDASGYVSDEETASNIEMLVNHFGAKIVLLVALSTASGSLSSLDIAGNITLAIVLFIVEFIKLG